MARYQGKLKDYLRWIDINYHHRMKELKKLIHADITRCMK